MENDRQERAPGEYPQLSVPPFRADRHDPHSLGHIRQPAGLCEKGPGLRRAGSAVRGGGVPPQHPGSHGRHGVHQGLPPPGAPLRLHARLRGNPPPLLRIHPRGGQARRVLERRGVYPFHPGEGRFRLPRPDGPQPCRPPFRLRRHRRRERGGNLAGHAVEPRASGRHSIGQGRRRVRRAVGALRRGLPRRPPSPRPQGIPGLRRRHAGEDPHRLFGGLGVPARLLHPGHDDIGELFENADGARGHPTRLGVLPADHAQAQRHAGRHRPSDPDGNPGLPRKIPSGRLPRHGNGQGARPAV